MTFLLTLRLAISAIWVACSFVALPRPSILLFWSLAVLMKFDTEIPMGTKSGIGMNYTIFVYGLYDNKLISLRKFNRKIKTKFFT